MNKALEEVREMLKASDDEGDKKRQGRCGKDEAQGQG